MSKPNVGTWVDFLIKACSIPCFLSDFTLRVHTILGRFAIFAVFEGIWSDLVKVWVVENLDGIEALIEVVSL